MMVRKISTFTAALSAAAVFATVSTEARAQQVASLQAVQAGVAAAVRGDVKLVSFRTPKAVGRNISSGDAVFLGDKVAAGPKAGLQIMLMDETIFTIGPESAIVIDKFIYDPEKGTGKVSAKILHGVFRFVSGRVAANKPSDMEVKLPNGTIGIRGTSAGGFVRDGVSEVVLLGPGPENNVGEPGGRIIVSGAGLGDGVDISRVNFGTRLAGGAPPTAPIRWSAQKMNSLTGALRSARPTRPQQPDTAPAPNGAADQNDASNETSGPRPGPGPDSGTTVTQQAGQDVGGAAVESGLLHRVGARQGAIGDHAGAHINQLKNTLSGIATVAQLNQITTGTFAYNSTTVNFTANSNYVFNYSIDFASKSTTGSVQINTSVLDTGFANGSGTFNLAHDIFNDPSGVLDITEGGPTTHVPGLNGNDNRVTVKYKFVNDGALATRIEHSVSYAEPQGAPTRSLSGSGVSDRPK